MSTLAGRVVLVTGAGSGIGRANGDYVVPEWWRSYAFALTMIIDKFERSL